MPSIGGLTSHLTCLVYLPYLGKLYNPENHKVGGKNKKRHFEDEGRKLHCCSSPGPQQQTCSSSVRRLDGTDGQMDGRTDGRKTVS